MLSRLTSRSLGTSAACSRTAGIFRDEREVAFPIAGKSPKVVSLAEATRDIKSGDNVFVHGIAATPTPLLQSLSEHAVANNLNKIKLHHLHLEGATPWTAEGVRGEHLHENEDKRTLLTSTPLVLRFVIDFKTLKK